MASLQASAGTGKSFLLTTVFLWCILNDMNAKACAPTGIAAANIELEGTLVGASTMHNMFDFDGSYASKLDFNKTSTDKVRALISLQVLFFDEVSMLDVDIWDAMSKILSIADHTRHRGFMEQADEYGSVHVILFGDFKQLPPATSKPPFVAIPRVHLNFDFRVLRQNRRVIADDSRKDEIENFHGVLHDISYGISSERVKRFLIQAYLFVFFSIGM